MNTKVDSEKLLRYTRVIGIIAVAGVAIVLGVYFIVLPDREAWGQFGDYMGGTLNPIFGLLSLSLLVLTISLQLRQLELAYEQLENSREELRLTRVELAASATAQQEMAKSQATTAKAQEAAADSLAQAARAQIDTSRAIREQSQYAALSAQISVYRAGFDVASQVVSQIRNGGMTSTDPSYYQSMVKEKERLAGEIHDAVKLVRPRTRNVETGESN